MMNLYGRWRCVLMGFIFYHNATVKRRVHDDNVSLGKMRDKRKKGLNFWKIYIKAIKKHWNLHRVFNCPKKR